MFQSHYQVLRPVTTAHLAQTMTLLSLTSEELKQQIDAELASNPALELSEERRCPVCRRLLPPKGNCPVCSKPLDNHSDEAIIFISPRDDFFGGQLSVDDEIPDDMFGSEDEDLPQYVLRQIGPDLNPEDRRLAAFMLTHLDEDGFLTTSLMEVARYFHLPITKVEEIQKVIQRADPVGVGSCNPQQALLAQMEALSESITVPGLAKKIVVEGMEAFMHRQYSELAQRFGASVRQIKQAIGFISENLYPYPGRSHWGESRHANTRSEVFRQPDIIISHLNDDPANPLMVEIIFPISGTLRVNPLFRQVVKQAEDEKREEWKNDLDRASLFVKCLQQRNHTMVRLMQKVVALQRDFIFQDEKALKSVTRSQLSKELDVHESTISRAVSSKTVQLPNRRIVPLACFFDRNLNVRSVLKEIIAEEPKPLSDTELAQLLSKKGFQVARRTVAKYRSMEGILPAHLRMAATH